MYLCKQHSEHRPLKTKILVNSEKHWKFTVCTKNIHQDLILCANINKPIGFTGTQTRFILTYRPKNCFKMSCDLLLASAGLVHLLYLPVHPGAQGIREWGKWKPRVQGTETREMCVEGFQSMVGSSSAVPWGSGGIAIKLSVLTRGILPNTVE